MDTATPSRNLPKSNLHQSIVSAATDDTALRGPNPPPLHQARDLNDEDYAGTNPDFVHPEHEGPPPPSFDGIVNLVIVCCHAIFHPPPSMGDFPLYSPYEEQNWHLASFQQSDEEKGKPGEHETFMSHIRAGLETLTSGSWAGKSLLVFTGGATKQDLTPISEARSYYHAALASTFPQGHKGGGYVKELFDKQRIKLEEHATDSYQNLLFSILLFRRSTGIYPHQIRVISHAFKSKRFLCLHAPAITWPPDRIRVVGIDPVMSAAEYEETVQGEELRGFRPWVDDPLGTGDFLSRKRRLRGWDENMTQAIVDGLEESVVRLVEGEAVKVLPWHASPSSSSPR
jgi:hypothetical protein